jgi:UDP-N-acetylmuramate dehydrogenase
MGITETVKKLKERFGNMILQNHSLAELNTFGTGGKARIFAEVKTSQELIDIVKMATELGLDYMMLGGGSNVLVSDNGFDGLIIQNSIHGMELEGSDIICGAGEELTSLIDFAAKNDLSGLEFATGIYGRVGGAIYGNAGAYGANIGSIVVWVEVVDRQGNTKTLTGDELEFGYRSSRLKSSGEFAVRARFALKQGKKEAIRHRMEEISAIRNEKLPVNIPSAGCFFRNIPDGNEEFGKLAAGKLLDQIGAKEFHFGGAAVFDKHANIIINKDSARSSDIWRLARLLKTRVKEKFGVELEEEITYVGNFEEEDL